MTIMMQAMEHILKQEKGKERYLKEISAALSLCTCHTT